ncbi:hypothetical protein Bbelb_342670 [Branchiostoma belcheri]|nr:hypothetical protein Bbelb_342670 [Branchiostoma belcheri]
MAHGRDRVDQLRWGVEERRGRSRFFAGAKQNGAGRSRTAGAKRKEFHGDAGRRHDAERAPTVRVTIKCSFTASCRGLVVPGIYTGLQTRRDPARDAPGSSLDPARDLTATRPNCKRRSEPYRKPHGSRGETDRAPDGSLTETGRQGDQKARQPLPAGLKLAISLRFLATGNSYRSLEFPLRVAHMQHNITVLKYMYAGLSSRLFSTAHRHSAVHGACSAARRAPGSEVTASLRRISPNGARSDFNSELKSIRRPRGAKNRPAAVGEPAGLRPALGVAGVGLFRSPAEPLAATILGLRLHRRTPRSIRKAISFRGRGAESSVLCQTTAGIPVRVFGPCPTFAGCQAAADTPVRLSCPVSIFAGCLYSAGLVQAVAGVGRELACARGARRGEKTGRFGDFAPFGRPNGLVTGWRWSRRRRW